MQKKERKVYVRNMIMKYGKNIVFWMVIMRKQLYRIR